MNRHNGIVRETLELLKERGFVPTVDDRGKHFKIRWVDSGRVYTVIVSRTPGDPNVARINRAMLKRILRKNGTGSRHA
jgi:hypothetical protein